jgi:glycosyltransferase 2 family protein
MRLRFRPFKENVPRNWLTSGLFIFSLSLLLATQGVSELEKTLFLSIYRLSDILRPIFYVLTLLGSTWAVISLVVGLGLFKKFKPALDLLAATVTAFGFAILFKLLVARGRPEALMSGVESREIFETGPGFPSGHTAVATAIALTIMTFLPKRYRWGLVTLALLVGVSRIYLGVHMPLDVVGGFGLGLIAAGMIQLLPHLWQKIHVRN